MSYLVLAGVVLMLTFVVYAWCQHRTHCKHEPIRRYFATARLGAYHPSSRSVYNHKFILSMGRALDPQDVLPPYFKWKERILVPIRNQGKCASCWAFAVSDCVADRLSIMTGGKVRNSLSVQELVSCLNKSIFTCKRGGIPELAYTYIIAQGLTNETSYPYLQSRNREIVPCAANVDSHWYNYILPIDPTTRRNEHKVYGQSGSSKNLCNKISTTPLFSATTQSEEHKQNIVNMKTDIYLYGPIVGTMFVRKDFYKYDGTKIYQSSPSSPVMGGHAIEILGWSEEGSNTHEKGFSGAYWICRNSWGMWPKRLPYGLMYIAMGINESGIESRASSILPLLNRTTQEYANTTDKSSLYYDRYLDYVNDPKRINFIATDTHHEQFM